VHRDREAQVAHAEIRRQLLGGGVARRWDDRIDVAEPQAGVGHRLARHPQHHLHGQLVGAADVVGLGDADDGGALCEAGHRGGMP